MPLGFFADVFLDEAFEEEKRPAGLLWANRAGRSVSFVGWSRTRDSIWLESTKWISSIVEN